MRLPSARPARAIVVVLSWIAAASVAGFIGVTAIGAVGDGITGSSTTPLSADQVDQRLAVSGTTSVPPPATSTPGSTAPATTVAPPSSTPPVVPPPVTTEPPPDDGVGANRVISTAGGSIVVQCRGASPVIVSATPAQGFQVEKDGDEGEGRARVEFESDELRVRVEIVCVDGVPRETVEVDD